MIESVQFLNCFLPIEGVDEIIANALCCLSAETVCGLIDVAVIDEYRRLIEPCFRQAIGDVIDLRSFERDFERLD